MSNIDNIFNKIIADAKTQADSLVEEAQVKGKALIAEKEELARNLASSIIAKAEEEAPQVVDKKTAAAELKARDMILSEKGKLIDRIIEKVKVDLANIDEKTFISLVKKSLGEVELNKDSELIVPENRKEALKKEDLGIKISKDTVENGFSLRNGDIIYNNTFDALVESRRDELEREIANQLSMRR